ncbi:MAG TPA: DUF3606 domain-containing protein [Burkholderiales bacterium]
MTQDSYRSAREPNRIDLDNDDEIRWWAKELGVSGVAILDAVEKVGPLVDDVRRHLDQALAGGQADA